MGVALDELRETIERTTSGTATGNIKNLSNIPLTRQSEKILRITQLETKVFKSEKVETEHLLLAILRDEDNLATQILDKFSVTYEVVKELLEYQSQTPRNTTDDGEEDDSKMFGNSGSQGGQRGDASAKGSVEKSRTPVLDNF